MEQLNSSSDLIIPEQEVVQSSPFIEANTKNVSLSHLKKDCTVPVFSKDNEVTIAHHEFIEAVDDCVKSIFSGQRILQPEIRTSHVIKGRIPEAIGKPVKELLETDKTIYYERMMFKIDIPSIIEQVGENKLNLTIGGVRAYNQENLYSKKTIEKFKVFIGFKNLVCTNLCVSSDGFVEEMRVSNQNQLKDKVLELIGGYQMQNHLSLLQKLNEISISDKQFARLLGRCRMYQFLPKKERASVPELRLNDGQLTSIAKGYFTDENFSRSDDGLISLWNVFNLLTSANKSSYIDTFLSRSVNSQELVQNLCNSLDSGMPNWYLN